MYFQNRICVCSHFFGLVFDVFMDFGWPRFGYLVEKAGGKTSNGIDGESILDTKITGIDQRTPLCIGSACEVTLGSRGGSAVRRVFSGALMAQGGCCRSLRVI